MKCARIKCVEDSCYLIVYGCLNYHIRELILCSQHGEEWAMQQHNHHIACSQCHSNIDSYEFQWTDQLQWP